MDSKQRHNSNDKPATSEQIKGVGIPTSDVDDFELVPPDESWKALPASNAPSTKHYSRRRTPITLAVNNDVSVTKLPKAVYPGDLKLGNAIIKCAVLDDGTRVLTQRGFHVALGRHKNPNKGQSMIDDRPAFLSAKNLEKYITNDLRDSWAPIRFRSQGGYMGNIAFGYRAELLPMVCYVFIDALEDKSEGENGALVGYQVAIAEQCKILVRGLATVGIIALVDEATGYQDVRDRLALEKILEKYIKDEWSKMWVRRFGVQFYKEMFRLWGWSFDEKSTKRPILAAKLTNEIIYARLAPGVLKTLKEKVPRNDRGEPISKLHMGLTDDIGIPELEDHIKLVVGFMQASRTRRGFLRLLDRVKPKFDDYGNPVPMNTEMDYDDP